MRTQNDWFAHRWAVHFVWKKDKGIPHRVGGGGRTESHKTLGAPPEIPPENFRPTVFLAPQRIFLTILQYFDPFCGKKKSPSRHPSGGNLKIRCGPMLWALEQKTVTVSPPSGSVLKTRSILWTSEQNSSSPPTGGRDPISTHFVGLWTKKVSLSRHPLARKQNWTNFVGF